MTAKQNRGEAIADFAGAIAASFSDHIPEYLSNNLLVLAAWWSIPLYIQGKKQHRWRRLNSHEWRVGADKMAWWLMFHHKILGEEGQMDDDIKDGLSDIIVREINFWRVLFDDFRKPAEMNDQDLSFDKLYRAFSNPELKLSETHGLYASEDIEEDDEPYDDIEDFCRVISRLIDMSARSHP